MRNTGSKDKHGRYMSVGQLQKKLLRMSAELEHFAGQLYRRSPMKNLIDFNKLHDLRDHFVKIGEMKIDQGNR